MTHIFADRIPKMKVKCATQVLNHTVANFIDLVITCNKGIVKTTKGDMHLPSSAAITLDVLLFFDDLFDSFNGKESKKYSSVITSSSNHIPFWLNILRKMDFVDNIIHKYIRHNTKYLANWI